MGIFDLILSIREVNIMKHLWTLLSIFCFCSFGINLQANDNIVIVWNQMTLQLIQQNKTPPPIAARGLSIVHTSMYNAWTPYDKKGASTRRGTTLKRPESEHTLANKNEAISFAAFRALSDLYPAQSSTLADLMQSLGYDPSYITPEMITPAGIGNLSAFDVLAFRPFDASNQLGNEPGCPGTPYSDYTDYQPVNPPNQLIDPNCWQPLIINGQVQKFLTPQWGCVSLFALRTPDEFFPSVLPARYPSKEYKKQAKAVLKLSANLNDETKSIVEYWADGAGTVTPPGHWNLFGQFVSHRDQHTLDDDIKMFFVLNNALCDASIAVWYVKRICDSERPITAIHFLFNNKEVKAWAGPGLGTQKILGQDWQPYLSPTPPFAEFVSGHSTFSSAAAEVLKLFTGSHKFGDSAVILKGSSKVEPGLVPAHNITLSWKTFKEAAEQAGFSRRLGGIHFEDADIQGRIMGEKIGKLNFEVAERYIHGLSTENVPHR
jgi:hypothetical protein